MTDRMLMIVFYVSIMPMAAALVGLFAHDARYATCTAIAITIVAVIPIVRGRLPRWFLKMIDGPLLDEHGYEIR